MTDQRPRNDAAMAEILASIRRIVADEDRRGAQQTPFLAQGDVLVLTQEMRISNDDGDCDDDEATAVSNVAPQRLGAAVMKPNPTPAYDQSTEETGSAPEAALSVDEAAVVDIARIVLRDEFEGEFGRNLTEQITQLVRVEVARALAEQSRARD
ncbi:MAG: hypothetical protein CVT86_02405 [Alphaproteobacteria bacterium HGW-Alphaproteobacteria-8]|nr:MAG: hypothetical protein CVT86_02405 [Alphaproteobacteria bacterium HGW-Alphaproteobacteria-8]